MEKFYHQESGFLGQTQPQLSGSRKIRSTSCERFSSKFQLRSLERKGEPYFVPLNRQQKYKSVTHCVMQHHPTKFPLENDLHEYCFSYRFPTIVIPFKRQKVKEIFNCINCHKDKMLKCQGFGTLFWSLMLVVCIAFVKSPIYFFLKCGIIESNALCHRQSVGQEWEKRNQSTSCQDLGAERKYGVFL